MMKSLGVAVLLAVGAFPVASPAQGTDAVNATYEVQVRSSFGTEFTDCFRFDVPGNFRLTIDGFGPPLTYRFGDLNGERGRFKSVSRGADSGAPFEIMFFGNFLDFGGIKGEALNEFGNSFVFRGARNESCPLAVSEAAKNPYRQ